MSYSFTVRAATKQEAKAKVREEFLKVVTDQVCHRRDCDDAVVAAYHFIDLLTDNGSKDVFVQMCGSLNGVWSGSADVTRIEGASININAAMVAKLQAVG